jgi:hypothetical protein
MTSHDACVAAWAKAYKDDGWTVHADINGYLAPPEINQKIPDIYATNGSSARVLEVETDETINTDHAKEQIATFKKWADQSPNRKFRLSLANANGCNEVK